MNKSIINVLPRRNASLRFRFIDLKMRWIIHRSLRNSLIHRNYLSSLQTDQKMKISYVQIE